MKIKRIKSIDINCSTFKVLWDTKQHGGGVDYSKRTITIGVKKNSDAETFMVLCHELQEIAAIEASTRYTSLDSDTSYLFSYNHKQHDLMSNMFAGWLSKFI